MVEYQTRPETPQGRLDRTFQALADPTRRSILGRLRVGAATVGQIAEPFEMSLNAVSKHLRVLEGAGLIRREVRGREHHCHLEAGPMQQAAAFTDEYRSFWEGRLDALDAFLREDAAAPEARRAPKPRRKKPASASESKR